MLVYVGVAAGACLVAVVGWVIYMDPVRCRRRCRKMVSAQVLARADALDGHLLFVGFPFPELVLDPKAPPEAWDDRPREWVRVLGRRGGLLVLEEHGEQDALGSDWYVYCDAEGNAVDWWAVPSNDLPDFVDPDSILPGDTQFARS